MINVSPNYTYNQPSFTSRDLTIRRADDLARRVNQVFPRISPSNLEGFNNAEAYSDVCQKYWDNIDDMRWAFRVKMDSLIDPKQIIKAYTKLISKNRLGNCGESAGLAYLAARINGIENMTIAGVYQVDQDLCERIKKLNKVNWDSEVSPASLNDLDHAVLRVKDGKNTYVIDPWLGFADYLPNAILRYKNEFGYHFDDLNLRPDIKDRLVVKSEDYTIEGIINDISKADLQKSFPKLKLPEPKQNKVNPV